MTVLIAIPVHERERLVRFCLATVARMALPAGSEVLLIDDASKTFDPAAVAAEAGLTVTLLRLRSPIGADAAAWLAMTRCCASAHAHLLVIDSDMVANRTALTDGLVALEQFDGLLSLYNSLMHPAVETDRDIVRKRSLGNAGTLWRRDLVEMVVKDMQPGSAIDHRYSAFFNTRGIGLASMARSRIQHLGFEGVNNRYFGNLEHGIGFVPDDEHQTAALLGVYDDLLTRQAHFLAQPGTRQSASQLTRALWRALRARR